MTIHDTLQLIRDQIQDYILEYWGSEPPHTPTDLTPLSRDQAIDQSVLLTLHRILGNLKARQAAQPTQWVDLDLTLFPMYVPSLKVYQILRPMLFNGLRLRLVPSGQPLSFILVLTLDGGELGPLDALGQLLPDCYAPQIQAARTRDLTDDELQDLIYGLYANQDAHTVNWSLTRTLLDAYLRIQDQIEGTLRTLPEVEQLVLHVPVSSVIPPASSVPMAVLVDYLNASLDFTHHQFTIYPGEDGLHLNVFIYQTPLRKSIHHVNPL